MTIDDEEVDIDDEEVDLVTKAIMTIVQYQDPKTWEPRIRVYVQDLYRLNAIAPKPSPVNWWRIAFILLAVANGILWML